MSAQVGRGYNICSSLLQHSIAGRLLQPAACTGLAGLPVFLQPFISLRSFSAESNNTNHLRDFAIIGNDVGGPCPAGLRRFDQNAEPARIIPSQL